MIHHGDFTSRNRDTEVSYLEMNIIIGAMDSVRGKGTASKINKNLNQFALDNFYLMTLQKTNMILDFRNSIDKLKNQKMKELVVHSTLRVGRGNIPNDTTNMVKADLFPIFLNLSTVTIVAPWFPFSVPRFLDELSSVDLPSSLSTIAIKDWGDNWIHDNWVRSAFDSNLKEKAAALDMTVDLKTGGYYDDDWLTIGIKQ